MARTKRGAKDDRVEREPDSEVRSDLRSACKANDVQRVAELLNGNSVTAADATECLDETTQHLPLMRLLLEHGADPAACATTRCMGESIELVKLLVEFGYDIKKNGHWVLQDYADSRESIDWLLDQGVDINRTDHEYKNDGGRYCLRSRNFSLELLNKAAASGDIVYFDHLVSRGADPQKSLALHSACECEDPEQTTAMISHLLDVHHMDIEADNEDFRDYFHASSDAGTPLNSAVYYRNLPAFLLLLKRGADPEMAVYQTIDDVFTQAWLPAVGPLLDAGADPNDALEHAVDNLNFEAAKICLDKGADPTRVLQKQQLKANKKASGSFHSVQDRVDGDGGFSSDDNEETAARRKEMRELVRLAGANWNSSDAGQVDCGRTD